MLPAEPARSLAIVTCMDCRIDPLPLFDLAIGDAHVIRNAGGLVTDDVIRSLALSQALLGTREVTVVQHTGCGLLGDEHELRDRVSEATGAEPPRPLGAFRDLDASVRRQLERLGSAPELVDGRAARGFVYEIETGALREVSRAAPPGSRQGWSSAR